MTDTQALIARLEAAEWYCHAPCNGPVHPYRWHHRLLHWLCWIAVIKIVPVRFMLSWPFKWMLPHCGNHAYACTCPHNIAAALRAKQVTG